MSAAGALGAAHRRRLREVWRSAGWPCQDMVEVELLAAGLLERVRDGDGRESVRVTDAGIRVLAATLAKNRAARSAHEALVAEVATAMQRAGRVVWRGLSLRAPLPGPDGSTVWAVAMPDVFSIRHTTVEDYAEPAVHEIKVRRADLLSDLRHADKGAAYRALSSQCWYVLRAGIAEPDEVPAVYGVMVARAGGLEVLRPAPRRAARVPFAVWMALARAHAEPGPDDAEQAPLAPSGP
ncbi:hypothetical protein ACPOLB_15780 [Rubrivivax sp. RP6-9]|uniref:hypothetical protein n=1 Tax=Rubrivivax sp. RP6-9 TaxID=3415750 RepID=UPI003CC67B5A